MEGIVIIFGILTVCERILSAPSTSLKYSNYNFTNDDDYSSRIVFVDSDEVEFERRTKFDNIKYPDRHSVQELSGVNDNSKKNKYDSSINSRFFENKSAKSTSSKEHLVDHEKIIFQDENKIMPVSPCEGSTFCTDVPHYPAQIVKENFQRNPNLKLQLTNDAPPVIVQSRFGPAEADPMCNALEKIVFPKAAKNYNGEWQYIVNDAENVQAVRMEVCENADSRCSIIDSFLDPVYETACKQKYMFRPFIAVLPNKTIGTSYFEIPSSCCCQVKLIESRQGRLGRSAKKENEP